MNAINPDTLAQAANTQYDSLSDEDLLELLNASIKVKTGHQGRFSQPHQPVQKREVNLDKYLGGPQ